MLFFIKTVLVTLLLCDQNDTYKIFGGSDVLSSSPVDTSSVPQELMEPIWVERYPRTWRDAAYTEWPCVTIIQLVGEFPIRKSPETRPNGIRIAYPSTAILLPGWRR